MSLWPADQEGLREEARALAGSIAEMFVGDASRSAAKDTAARVAAQRTMIESLETDSPAGQDEVVAGVPCRVFRRAQPRGTYLHFHGGAMILGSPRMNDVANGELSERLDVDVVSVDYRLAPEHPFPAGSDDCLAVAEAVLSSTSGPVVVGGESAGGYFAALTLLRIRDELGAVGRVTGANLVFGIYDLSGTPSNRGARPSNVPDVLEDDTADFVLECYTPGMSREDVRDPKISPMYAGLHDMPPALFTVGSADHLLDDSLFLHQRWLAYGNESELAVYPDCVHGFNGFPMELARLANGRIDAFLDKAFSR